MSGDTAIYIIFLQVVLVVLSWDWKARTFVRLQFDTVNGIHAPIGGRKKSGTQCHAQVTNQMGPGSLLFVCRSTY